MSDNLDARIVALYDKIEKRELALIKENYLLKVEVRYFKFNNFYIALFFSVFVLMEVTPYRHEFRELIDTHQTLVLSSLFLTSYLTFMVACCEKFNPWINGIIYVVVGFTAYYIKGYFS